VSVDVQRGARVVVHARGVVPGQTHVTRSEAHLPGAGPRGGAPRPAPGPQAEGETLLHRLWGSFEPDLQDALSLAYNQAKREGKTRISTRTFFAAVARLRPGRLAQLLDRLPEDSLPEPVGEEVPRRGPILEEEPLLSTCVENALVALARKADPEHRMTVEEVFVDVAKHGTGASVAHLRERGVTPQRIDELVEEVGGEVRER